MSGTDFVVPTAVASLRTRLTRRIGFLILASVVYGCTKGPEETETGSGQAVHWDYDSEHGPDGWGDLSPRFSACKSGLEQSPIDLDSSAPTEKGDAEREYEPASLEIAHHEHVVDLLDNGHTIQVTYDEGSVLRERSKPFELKQFHFHAPGEHTVDGKSFPMEMHLVHSGDDGELTVVAVLITEGKHNNSFDPVLSNLPDSPGDSRSLEHVTVDIDELLPDDNRHYRYQGSLTTPPCSEGVNWFVIVSPVELSPEQITVFSEVLHKNNRPVQPLNGRVVVIRIAETPSAEDQ